MARVLIAEDDPHIIRVMSLWLRQHGHTVFETPNGAVALETLSREPVDVLISDMNMPEMNGLALSQAVREQLHLEIPILVLSSRCDLYELNEQVRPFGVQLFPKPFVPSRLVAEIDRLLGVTA